MTTASRVRLGGGFIALAVTLLLLLSLLVGVSGAAPKGGTRQKPKPAEPPALPTGTMELPPATPVKLPAAVDAAIPGGGGKYLVLHLKKLQQLAIFDVQQPKVVKYLPVASGDIAYAAGSEKLFVVGQWVAIAPDGQFLLTGFQEIYRKGHDIIDNPDRIWIVPTYGSIDSLARYELNPAGVPVRVAYRAGVGGNGQGIRLSADGKRSAYLSVGGYPDLSRNLAGWNPLNLRDLPVAYLTKDVATSADLAFHPLLPLVASHGKGSVAFYDRESGEAQKERVNDDEIAGEDIQQVYFSPDGKSVVLHTVVQSVHYLYHTPLKLSADEVKSVRALPRPDRPLRRDDRLPAKPGGESRKLPQIEARGGDAVRGLGFAG